MRTPDYVMNELQRLKRVLKLDASSRELSDLGDINDPLIESDPYDVFNVDAIELFISRSRRLEAARRTTADYCTTGQFLGTRVFTGPGNDYLAHSFVKLLGVVCYEHAIKAKFHVTSKGVVEISGWPEGVMYGTWFDDFMERNFVRIID